MEAKLPERITSAVKSAKKRSTRFIQDEDVGREVRLEARVAGEPGLDLRMLMSGIVVLDQMDVEFLGRFAVDLLQKSQPFDMSVARTITRSTCLSSHRVPQTT